jgi:Spy/CpxP family protein refolding chaperone
MPLKDNSKLKGAIVLVAVVLVTGAIGAVVSAQMGPRGSAGQMGPGGPGGMGHGPGMRGGPGMMGGPGGPLGLIGRGLHALDLTDEQREKIRAIAESHRDELKAIADRGQPAREALHDAVTAPVADENAIRAAAAGVAAVEVDAALLHAKVHAEVFSVLTPDQQKKAEELRARMQERMKEGRDRIRKRLDQRIPPKRSGPEAV